MRNFVRLGFMMRFGRVSYIIPLSLPNDTKAQMNRNFIMAHFKTIVDIDVDVQYGSVFDTWLRKVLASECHHICNSYCPRPCSVIQRTWYFFSLKDLQLIMWWNFYHIQPDVPSKGGYIQNCQRRKQPKNRMCLTYSLRVQQGSDQIMTGHVVILYNIPGTRERPNLQLWRIREAINRLYMRMPPGTQWLIHPLTTGWLCDMGTLSELLVL